VYGQGVIPGYGFARRIYGQIHFLRLASFQRLYLIRLESNAPTLGFVRGKADILDGI
jgi:hypothetical protein